MLSESTQEALDTVWKAQDELWKPRPDYKRVRTLGLDALYRLTHPRHRSNACLVLAKAHEGLHSWYIAVLYWEDCRDLYPAGWNKDMQRRLDICYEYRAAEELRLNRAVQRNRTRR